MAAGRKSDHTFPDGTRGEYKTDAGPIEKVGLRRAELMEKGPRNYERRDDGALVTHYDLSDEGSRCLIVRDGGAEEWVPYSRIRRIL